MMISLKFACCVCQDGQRNQRRMMSQLGKASVLMLVLWFSLVKMVVAEDSFCAQVSIEIKQQLTLERQAFDAHMRINNGLTGFNVEHVRVDVKITDDKGTPVLATSDASNTKAAFFIRIDNLNGIDNITGTGIVPASSSADIHWLLIPSPGSAGKTSTGKLYFVGATLTYQLNGEQKVTEITPDFIYVKPTPLLSLDYFLPKDVYADDAFTAKIEPPVPFTLGVRVTNNGENTASHLKIDSGQPKIIDNQLGLLINFKIDGSFIDDNPVAPVLLLDFGDVSAKSSRMGRWQMQTTLSGQFIDFTAQFSHSDELGGELTSLFNSAVTHELVHDVVVDLPGRDTIHDFLAKDVDVMRVYESNGVDTLVSDQSATAQLTPAYQQGKQVGFHLSTPVTDGFLYARLPDPHSGNKAIVKLLRSDGKSLQSANYWLSKTRTATNNWNYFINVFDQNSNGQYDLVMDAMPTTPHAPVLQFIPDRTTAEARSVGFIVEASDEDGTVPTLNADNLPDGAVFIDRQDGVGLFSWTPTAKQQGIYTIKYVASDGQLSDQRTAKIIVNDKQVILTQQEVSFTKGLNLFSYPLSVLEPDNTCLNLLQTLGRSEVVSSISRFNPTTQQIEQCNQSSTHDFATHAGEALMVQMVSDKTVQIVGQAACPVWVMQPGPNFVGHPNPPENFSCFDVVALIKQDAATIQSFNKSNGKFEFCAWDPASKRAIGSDFAIQATDGLIVNSYNQLLINLPGCE